MKQFLFIILAILLYHKSIAQDTILLTGTIRDSTTHNALPGANIYLATTQNSYIASSDNNGNFSITVAPGNYYLSITYTGYAKKEKPDITITGIQHLDIQLLSTSKELKTVEIKGNANKINTLAGGYQFNIPLNNLLTGKNLVNQLPGVHVSNDAITLLGDNKIQVLINGVSTSLSGKELVNYLQQLQGNTLEKIEVYTTPPASFDANGSGVINIITRKNKTFGWTGQVNGSLATHDKQQAAQSFQLNTRKFIVFESFSYNHYNERQKEESDNTLLKTGETYHYKYTATSQPSNFLLAEGGGNFKPDSSNNIGFKITHTRYDHHYNSASSIGEDSQNTRQSLHILNTRYNLNYKKQFHQKGQILTSEFNYYNLSKNQQDSIFTNSSSYTQQAVTGIRIVNGKADLTTPLSHSIQLLAGLKSANTHIDINSKAPLNYREQINAAYGILNIRQSKVSYSLGLRFEDTYLRINTADSTTTNHYSGLYPSVNITWHSNTANTFTISASRRLTRPAYTQLNPFTDQSSASNYRSGNPYLLPANAYLLEVSYNLNYDDNSLFSSAGFRHYNNIIEYITHTYAGNADILLTTPQNAGKADYVYVNTYLYQTITPKLTTSLNLTGYHIRYQSGTTTGNYTLSGKAGISYNLLKSVQTSLDYFFQTPQSTPQGAANSYQYLDISLSSAFLKDRINVQLSLSDVFNTNHNRYLVQDTSLISKGYVKVESQILKLSVSYRFGRSFKTQVTTFKTEQDNRSVLQK
jgi:outer membrane receptor protein involved in Fe transport